MRFVRWRDGWAGAGALAGIGVLNEVFHEQACNVVAGPNNAPSVVLRRAVRGEPRIRRRHSSWRASPARQPAPPATLHPAGGLAL
ncbi:hypothetical protein G6F62_014685 [Rhizopus arrhizus]|nr:hypothetical protein G6F62_014685 [Rhizopus arrhizus]